MFVVENLPNWEAVIHLIESDAGQRNNKWVALKIAKMLGLQYIGSGAHRVVLDYEDKALKVALSKRGIIENYRESELFLNLPDNEKQYFATCLGVGYGWALFERLEPMSYCVGYREYRKEMNEIRKTIAKLQINDIGSPRNWGIRGGREPVILDYSLYKDNFFSKKIP